MRFGNTSALAGIVVLASGLTARPAMADPLTREQLAQKLFDEAREVLSHGETARACRMLEESLRIDRAAGTLLNLALCHEEEGKLGSAYFELQEALGQAIRDARLDRETIAREHLSGLESRVPKLTVVPPQPVPEGFVIELDGVALPSLTLGVPLQADPGSHSIRVTAPHHHSWDWNGVLRVGDNARLEVPPLIPKLPPPPPRQVTHVSTASYILGGAAIAALGTSAVTGFFALREQAAYEQSCFAPRRYCKDESGAASASAARNLAWVSTGALLVGVSAGVTAFFLPRDIRLEPSVQPNGGSASLKGTF